MHALPRQSLYQAVLISDSSAVIQTAEDAKPLTHAKCIMYR